ncbi:hypothetical protein [Myceligenerans crystallogenes]|uniref:Uncharacterized protein n=1 Tax=Myceligenerans crystallogenes TaxID=316335 RepID=A0ABP4ZWP0_9MICO
MSPRLRLIIIWLVVIAVLSMIITDPHRASDTVIAVWNMIWDAVVNIATFFEQVFTGILEGF